MKVTWSGAGPTPSGPGTACGLRVGGRQEPFRTVCSEGFLPASVPQLLDLCFASPEWPASV
eukprot:2232585-Alexandrium_andersonii.AAC.1